MAIKTSAQPKAGDEEQTDLGAMIAQAVAAALGNAEAPEPTKRSTRKPKASVDSVTISFEHDKTTSGGTLRFAETTQDGSEWVELPDSLSGYFYARASLVESLGLAEGDSIHVTVEKV